MITIISGSRRVEVYSIVEAAICASGFTITEVIEGGQRTWDENHNTIIGGVDYFAEVWARRNSIPWRRVNARWKEHGKAAGPIRNREMAQIGEQLIAIPDSESTGTRNMILAAVQAGIPKERIFVYPVEQHSLATVTPISDKIRQKQEAKDRELYDAILDRVKHLDL